MKPATGKSWREKLEKPQERRVVPISPRMRKRFGEGTILIPSPLDVDALMRKPGRGRLVTFGRIRERLAKEHGAGVT
jgi:hypothetical protein